MKYKLLFLAILLVNEIKCQVTKNTKATRVKIITSDSEMFSGDQEPMKSGNHDRNSDYLEDVVFALKNQKWAEEEMPCLNRTLVLLRDLQNFTLWAVWQWDSAPPEPQGLLYGTRYQLGNFDQCLDMPWAASHPELQTQYCLANVVLEWPNQSTIQKFQEPVDPYQSALDFMQVHPRYVRPLNEMTWGVCMPAVCSHRSVDKVVGALLGRSHLGLAGIRPKITAAGPCQRSDSPNQFDGLFYSYVVVMTSLIAIAIMCTYLNSKKENDPGRKNSSLIQTFCLKTNLKELMNMRKEGIEVLYGVRFLSMCFIVMAHQLLMTVTGPMSNGMDIDRALMSTSGLLVLHFDLFTDTFFLLSGFLTATTLEKMKWLPNPLLIILKRYVRIVVAYAVVIFFVCAVYPYTGSGPLWQRAIEGDTYNCRKNWWLNLLMVNNYVNVDHLCIISSWYVPCDFHFFVVTLLVYWVYRKNFTLGVSCAGVLAVASVLAPGIAVYVNNMPANEFYIYEVLKVVLSHEQFQLIYVRSHMRYAAYLVGFFSGYIFAAFRATGNIDRISQKWSVFGALSGLMIMMATMIWGSLYNWREYSILEGAIYTALNRPVWACGLAILVLCCSLGNVPIIKPFLSWYGWVPLSRLSYGLYLTHIIIISRALLISRNEPYIDKFQLLTTTTGVVVVGCVAALIIWVVAEAPIINLFTFTLKKIFGKSLAEEITTSTNKETELAQVTSRTNQYISKV